MPFRAYRKAAEINQSRLLHLLGQSRSSACSSACTCTTSALRMRRIRFRTLLFAPLHKRRASW